MKNKAGKGKKLVRERKRREEKKTHFPSTVSRSVVML